MPAPDQITLNGDTLPTGTCGVFTGTVTSVDGNDVTSSLSFTPTQDMDGLLIECADGIGAAVSNFTIEIITENLKLDSVVDSTTTYGCVTATLASPTDTTGISNYRVEAILPGNGNVPSPSTSDDAADLEVEICGLNLCDESYTYRAHANGGNICPSNVTSAAPPSLSSLGRIDSLRIRNRDAIEWGRPSNAPSDCTIECYTVYVYRLAGGANITETTTSQMVSLSAFNPMPDICDSNLRFTVVAEVATIGLVLASETDPAFNPTSAFPANPTVAVGRPTYAISADNLTVIQLDITPIDEDVLQLFPDISRTVSYIGSQPLCDGSDTLEVQNNVIEINSTCLNDTNVDLTVTFMDDPDCISNTINLTSQSFPLISGQLTMRVTSKRAVISFPNSTQVAIQTDSFTVMGTATRVDGNDTFTSATYPADAIFNDLASNTSYSFVIQIVSQATDRTIIGSFSGTFMTPPSDGFPLWAIIVIIVAVIALMIAIGVIIGILIWWKYELWILGKDSPCWLIVVIIILCFVFVGLGILLIFLIRKCKKVYRDETDSPDSGTKKKHRKKKTTDVELESAGEYGRLQHGTMSPVLTNPGDQTYSQLATDKVEEASGEEYQQLNRRKPPQPVPNINDPNYSHFQGGQQEYSQLQHDQSPPVPPHTVQDPPMEYAEVNPGPRFTSKKMSSTNL